MIEKKMKVALVTTTRAEYGLLFPIIDRLNSDSRFSTKLLVSGTHLSKNFGYTKDEILHDGFRDIIIEVPIDLNEKSTSEIFSEYVTNFEYQFKKHKFDCVIVLGDRYEILAIASVCLFLNIPLIHISGGDVTFGAIDDACRHSITKMANLHFTGNDIMRKRVIQMGEDPKMVFNVGELGVENILKTKLMSLTELSKSLNFNLNKNKYVVATYHPETITNHDPSRQIDILIDFIKEHNEYQYIITKSNVDDGGISINNKLKLLAENNKNIYFIDSLGRVRYLSALKNCAFVLGNSSSGIIEAPYFKIPTINIGKRQDGRMQDVTIVNAEMNEKSLEKALLKCKDEDFLKICKKPNKLYGNGNTSQKICDILFEKLSKKQLVKYKQFYELRKEI